MLFNYLAETVATYDKLASIYAARWFDSKEAQPFLNKFLELVRPTDSILDLGCGSGRDTAYLQHHGYDCVGIDLSGTLLAEARRRAPAAFFRLMDIRHIRYPDSLFGGAICFGVLHHLFEEDLVEALEEIRRILSHNAPIAITLKIGSDFVRDEYGRIVRLYSRAEFCLLLEAAGFHLEHVEASSGADGTNWLQIIARNQKAAIPSEFTCSFCRSFLFPQNRLLKRPVAASILWGDANLFAAVDCSPLVEGHLLLISSRHEFSFMASDLSDGVVRSAKRNAKRILQDVYGRMPVILEHGTTNRPIMDTCIDHAHMHVLPLSRGLKNLVESSLGPLHLHTDYRRVREHLSEREYILYEDKTGRVHIKSEGLSQLESQFIRIIVGEYMGDQDVKWASMLGREAASERFYATISRVSSHLDEIERNTPITSKISQSRQARTISGKFEPPAQHFSHVQAVRDKFPAGTRLRDLGEDRITTEIVYAIIGGVASSHDILGDDAAIIDIDPKKMRSLVTTIDPCPRPVIFDLEEENYKYYGWLAIVISLSDIAAMGARPLCALLSCEMPEDMLADDFISFLDGALSASTYYECPIVGGNIKDAKTFSATTALTGYTGNEPPMRRVGARPGDSLFAVGTMGFFWAGVLARKYSALLGIEAERALLTSLRYPEPNVWVGIELSKSGVVTACMDASDGPTACFQQLALDNDVDIIVDRKSLKPHLAVTEVARQLGLDPSTLMLTWGNWELVFTARADEFYGRLDGHPIVLDVIHLGEIVAGAGGVYLDEISEATRMPDLSSKRFSSGSSFTHGLDRYIDLIRRTRLQVT